ncbi:hypothetical protein HON36_01010 [Candidatus Parcubacteria bacterium]|jgi:hypothetical protein|nr:hypothetical protein [Candidatus Parcubacteria bacterium]MBT7228220.1 hypothetical protein [Candidatus Parcubacteria bacterium]
MKKTRKKWSGLLFLIREGNEIKVTGKCPRNVKVNEERGTWTLGSFPPFRIGENSGRIHYSDCPGILGVFRSSNICHMHNMIACQNFHLRRILARQAREGGSPIPEEVLSWPEVNLADSKE